MEILEPNPETEHLGNILFFFFFSSPAMGVLPQKELSKKGLAVCLHFGKIGFLPLVIPLIQLSARLSAARI